MQAKITDLSSAQMTDAGTANDLFNQADPARARNTRLQGSDTVAISRHASLVLSASEVFVSEKFWRSLSALHNQRQARHRAGRGQTAEASRQSSDRYRALA